MKLAKLSICIMALLLSSQEIKGQEETANAQGLVCTLWGEPIEGAIVKFYQLEGIRGISTSEKLIQQTSTDLHGFYRVTALPPGQYRVEASLQGFANAEVWRFYLWRGADRVLDIGMSIGITHHLSQITVTGSVRKADHSPIEGATVTIHNAFDFSRVQQVRTDKTGTFKIEMIQPGQYIVYATRPGFLINSATIDLGNGSKEKIDLILNNGQPKYVKER